MFLCMYTPGGQTREGSTYSQWAFPPQLRKSKSSSSGVPRVPSPRGFKILKNGQVTLTPQSATRKRRHGLAGGTHTELTGGCKQENGALLFGQIFQFGRKHYKSEFLHLCVGVYPGICRWLIEGNAHVTNRQHSPQGLPGCNLRKTEQNYL